MLAPLADLIEVFAAIGSALGAAAGSMRPARSRRELVDNVVDGAALGAVGGASAALWMWSVARAAGLY